MTRIAERIKVPQDPHQFAWVTPNGKL